MPTNIEWLGHDSFRLRGEGPVVYIDPYKLERPEPAADLILITHDHHDHLDPEALAALRKDGTVIAGPHAVATQVGGCTEVKAGEERELAGVRVKVVPAYNVNKFRNPGEPFHPKGLGVGYLVEMDGETIYHTGDSDAIPEMEGLQPDVALLPVSGTYVMTADEAAEAARAIRPRRAIPMHYASIVGSDADARRFAELAQVPVEIPPKSS
jgi:L-ascorbate metabolism protein UlaG (beta-lactamase superfamily)